MPGGCSQTGTSSFPSGRRLSPEWDGRLLLATELYPYPEGPSVNILSVKALGEGKEVD